MSFVSKSSCERNRKLDFTLEKNLLTGLVMLHAEHSIFQMSTIVNVCLMNLQSVCKSSRVINTGGDMQIQYFLAFLFALTASWRFTLLEKGGMQIPEFVIMVYHIKSQHNAYTELTV